MAVEPLPEPISADPEVKVSRIVGAEHRPPVAAPYFDHDVIQGDPEVTVSRIRGIEHVDGQEGVLYADREAVEAARLPRQQDRALPPGSDPVPGATAEQENMTTSVGRPNGEGVSYIGGSDGTGVHESDRPNDGRVVLVDEPKRSVPPPVVPDEVRAAQQAQLDEALGKPPVEPKGKKADPES